MFNSENISKVLLNSIASTHVGVLITDEFRRTKWVNDAFLKEVGYAWEEIIDRNPGMFQGEATQIEAKKRLSEGLQNLEDFSVEIVNYTKSGEPFWVKLNISPLFENKKHVGYVAIQEMIDNLKKQQEANDLLLQEMHHRVKNNLAVISGMMELELFNARNIQLYQPLSRTRNRIISIAKVHELMYQTEEFNAISFDRYLNELIEGISFSMTNEESVHFDVQCSEICVGIDFAIPLGLLFNELITNSCKYAIEDTKNCIIEIDITQIDNTVSVKYCDNGPGMNVTPEEVSKESLGFQIIFALLSQIEARYKFSTKNKFQLEFFFEM